MLPPVETLKIYRPSVCPDIEVWAVQNTSTQCRLFHENYSICTVVDSHGGWVDWNYRGKSFRSGSGSLMLMEPGEVHWTKRIVARGSYFVMDVPKVYFHKVFEGLKAPHLKHANIDAAANFKPLLNFHRLIENGTTRLEAESRLMKCLRAVLLDAAEQTPKETISRPHESRLCYAKDYIHHHANSEISLDDLAQVSGLSQFHFVRSFHAHFGITPHAYQIKVRIARARRMLQRREDDIPYRLGFSDQSHFIRHFKRDIGVTPGQYARMLHKPISIA